LRDLLEACEQQHQPAQEDTISTERIHVSEKVREKSEKGVLENGSA